MNSVRSFLVCLLGCFSAMGVFGEGAPPPAPLDETVKKEIREYIERDVAGGFLTSAEIVQGILDVYGESHDVAALRKFAQDETRATLAAHARAQSSWPRVTDCDRLDAAFAKLEASGIVCRQNFSCCGTCGAGEIQDEIAEAQRAKRIVRGYAFYHVQDTESAVDGGGLYLNYGAVEDGERAAIAVGREITKALRAAGLEVTWDETWAVRIHVKLDWKRRR